MPSPRSNWNGKATVSHSASSRSRDDRVASRPSGNIPWYSTICRSQRKSRLDLQGESPAGPEYDPASHQLILSGLRLGPNQGLVVRMQTSRPSLAYTQPQIRLRVEKLLAAFRLGNKARGTIAHQAESWIS